MSAKWFGPSNGPCPCLPTRGFQKKSGTSAIGTKSALHVLEITLFECGVVVANYQRVVGQSLPSLGKRPDR